MRILAQKQKANAVQRLRDRISIRLDDERKQPRGFRKTQRGLAARLGITQGALSEMLSGPAATRGLLAHLDKIADYFGVPPSLLVHANDTALIELQRGEWRLVQHWRRLPPETQDAIMEVFDYFAGLLPEEKEQRRLYVKWRKLSAAQREQMERTLDDQIRGSRFRRDPDTEPAAPASGHETRAASGSHD